MNYGCHSEGNPADNLPETTPGDSVFSSDHQGISVAFALALRNGFYETASDILRLSWYDLFREPNPGEVRTLLESIPVGELAAYPLLAVRVGLMHYADPLRRAKAAEYFDLASAATTKSVADDDKSQAERALISAAQSTALRVGGKYAAAARAARESLQALHAIPWGRGTVVGALPQVYAQLGTSLIYGGQQLEAVDVFLRGYAEAGTSEMSSFSNLSMLAGIHALTGDLSEAEHYCAAARGAPWTDHQRSTHAGTFYRLAEAILALESGDVATALRHLAAVQHDRRTTEHWVAIAHVEAMASLVAGDPAGALAGVEAFSRSRALEARMPENRRALAPVRVLLHLALGNYRAARSIVDKDAGSDVQSHIDRARIDLFSGSVHDAHRHLQAITGESHTSRTWAEASVLVAAAALRRPSRKRADAAVMQLGAVLRETRQRVPLMLIPHEDVEAIRARSIELGYGDLFREQQVRSVVLDADAAGFLTPRELAVLRALASTSSTAAIAEQLFVSVNTVKSQLRSLYRKLDAHNRDEALTHALQRHLIQSRQA